MYGSAHVTVIVIYLHSFEHSIHRHAITAATKSKNHTVCEI